MWSLDNRQSAFLVGLDLGTTKVCCIIGETEKNGGLRILGVGTCPSQGMRRGDVIHIAHTADAIRTAVQEVETTSGLQVQTVMASIAGPHIKSATWRGAVRVTRADYQITSQDRDRALESARNALMPRTGEVIHLLPQAYRVDGLPGIQDPVGLSGVHLEADVHVVTGAILAIQNIYQSMMRADLNVLGLVLDPLASSYAVITPEEREVGTLMLDIGGGTTDSTLFYQGHLCHTGVVGLGGDNVTRDLAYVFKTTYDRAEPLKRQWQADMPGTVAFESIARRAPVEISKACVGEVIEARMEELFEAVYRQVEPTGLLDYLGGGIVLTGGGSLLWRCAEMAEQVFGLPASVRAPEGVSGLTEAVDSPIYSTGVGILRFMQETQVDLEIQSRSWWGRVRDVVEGVF